MKGPIQGYTESTRTNMNLLRNMLRTIVLTIESGSYGKNQKRLSKTVLKIVKGNY
ncbi:spore germination protein [Gottfriedia acidiceleris]|uniref:Spore germination protein n=1 Tax=Gottfriedia acidiceleris TaxID=371036 RepID=A0ABY4JJG0_9BACI|nr:spore germination protein [Gottfriedia acidiceleris]UPM53981.1 spore germination protein [Gottfriedia acidiceleris]